MQISNKDVRQFDELNELRIAFNSKLLEITATATEYAKPISIYDMICIGGEQLKEIFISKWDSCFEEGFLTRLNNEDFETAYIDEDDQEEEGQSPSPRTSQRWVTRQRTARRGSSG